MIPSRSRDLLDSDLFVVAGRLIGHSFIHGGPSFGGLSPAILYVLLGGSPEEAPIEIEDVADTRTRSSWYDNLPKISS